MSTEPEITTYFHCKQCIEECRDLQVSPKNYARLEVGLTAEGKIQVWCTRHDKQVVRLSVSAVPTALQSACSECPPPGKLN